MEALGILQAMLSIKKSSMKSRGTKWYILHYKFVSYINFVLVALLGFSSNNEEDLLCLNFQLNL